MSIRILSSFGNGLLREPLMKASCEKCRNKLAAPHDFMVRRTERCVNLQRRSDDSLEQFDQSQLPHTHEEH